MGIEGPVPIELGYLKKHDLYQVSNYKWAYPMPVTYV